MMAKTQPAVIADALEGITGAERVDDLTFRIQLKAPSASIFRQALVQLVILPKHVWENVADPVTWDPIANNGMVGSGPFAFESWSPSQTHVLKTFRSLLTKAAGIRRRFWVTKDRSP